MARATKQYEAIGGEVVKTTDAAVLVDLKDGSDQKWVPRSVCEDGDSLEEGDDDLRVEKWFAEKEGLI
jgi:hypothetical protein